MTKIMKKAFTNIFLVVMTSIFCLESSAVGEGYSVDLSAAIDLAIENNESYLIAKKEMERANSQIIEAAAGALPLITGGLTYLRNWRVPTGVFQFGDEIVTVKFGTDNSYTADLTLTQPLYSGGRTIAAIKIARLYKKLSRETVRSAGQNLKVEVYNAFFGAVLAREISRVSSQSLELARDNLKVVDKMYAQGVASEYDLLRAKVEVANLQPTVTRSETDFEVATSALKNLLGIGTDDELELEVEFDSSQFIVTPIDIPGFEDELIQNRPEVKISTYTSEGRKKAISLYTAGYKPSLNFRTTLQYQTQFDEGNVFERRWDRSLSSTLEINIPIFDSWKTPSRVRQAKIDYSQSELQKEAIRKAMILDLEQSYGKYIEARENLSAQGNAVELARRGLEIANVRFENGVGTQLEVSDARLQLQLAEINKATAFYDLAVGYAKLMRALGRDLEPIK
ncbi:MAG: TolC family protein [Candidatus Zixiibacteriota bacterium]|nr:MAG: TolC family protein [candidate division Zixibacteria bacterium]